MDQATIWGLIVEYRYLILVPLAFIEGPFVALIAGLLSALGYFDPFVVLGILIGKDISVDTACYALGRLGNRTALIKRYAAKIGIVEAHWSTVERLWEQHPWRTMFFSKLAYGLSLPFLVSAGLTRTTYSRFLFYAVQVSILQYGTLLFLGYYFGNSLTTVQNGVHIAQISLTVVGVAVVLYYILSHGVRKRLKQEAGDGT
jgi:membrane-associated protein